MIEVELGMGEKEYQELLRGILRLEKAITNLDEEMKTCIWREQDERSKQYTYLYDWLRDVERMKWPKAVTITCSLLSALSAGSIALLIGVAIR